MRFFLTCCANISNWIQLNEKEIPHAHLINIFKRARLFRLADSHKFGNNFLCDDDAICDGDGRTTDGIASAQDRTRTPRIHKPGRRRERERIVKYFYCNSLWCGKCLFHGSHKRFFENATCWHWRRRRRVCLFSARFWIILDDATMTIINRNVQKRWN